MDPPPPPPNSAPATATATVVPFLDPDRVSTVYDAVASRVTSEGFMDPRRADSSAVRQRSGIAVPADEVLARRRRATENVAPLSIEDVEKLRLPDNVRLPRLCVCVAVLCSCLTGSN